MSRQATVRIFCADGQFSHWVTTAARDELLANQELFELYDERPSGPHLIGYTHEKPVGQSNYDSPASITASEVELNGMAACGLASEIKPARLHYLRTKIKAFGEKPSWQVGIQRRSDIGKDERFARTYCGPEEGDAGLSTDGGQAEPAQQVEALSESICT